MPGEAHVFIACSLDGFIAGPDDDLSWLTGPDSATAEGDGEPRPESGGEPGAESGGEPGAEGGGEPGAEGGADEERDDHGFSAFFAKVGALLMGRRTHDVVAGFDEWYYGDKPVLVATTRPLDNPAAPTVRAVSGTPEEMLAQAREAAGDKNVYVDGGRLIRSFLDAGLIDEMTVSVIPIILGEGIPLFAGVARRHKLELIEMSPSGGKLVQLRYRPAPD
jgi:dihydrofolate reductase